MRTAHAIRAVCHLSTEMSVTRDELFAALEKYYRSCGLRPERAPLLPSPDCAERLYALLERVGLGERGNVEVYAAA